MRAVVNFPHEWTPPCEGGAAWKGPKRGKKWAWLACVVPGCRVCVETRPLLIYDERMVEAIRRIRGVHFISSIPGCSQKKEN